MKFGEARRVSAERQILGAMEMLRPEHCGPLNICRMAFLSYGRGAMALVRLTHRGVIEEVSVGRRTVYRRVGDAQSDQ